MRPEPTPGTDGGQQKSQKRCLPKDIHSCVALGASSQLPGFANLS
jgi:hypothetical protein